MVTLFCFLSSEGGVGATAPQLGNSQFSPLVAQSVLHSATNSSVWLARVRIPQAAEELEECLSGDRTSLLDVVRSPH